MADNDKDTPAGDHDNQERRESTSQQPHAREPSGSDAHLKIYVDSGSEISPRGGFPLGNYLSVSSRASLENSGQPLPPPDQGPSFYVDGERLYRSHEPRLYNYAQFNISGTERVAQNSIPLVSRHTLRRLDGWQEEFLPSLKDPHGDKKVNDLGVLQDGRRYACDVSQIRTASSGRLFMSAAECAKHMRYASVSSMIEANPSLFVFVVIGGVRLHSGNIDHYGVVSALSVFREFGHRVVDRGRRVFDDYFEIYAKEKGLSDDTLWGAALGHISEDQGFEAVYRASDSRFDEQDSTGRTPVHYMKARLQKATKDTGIMCHDDISKLFWTRALALSSPREAEEALREAIASSLASTEEGTALRPISRLETLTSALDFCLDVKALKRDLPIFDGSSDNGELGNTKPDTYILVCQWELPAVVDGLLRNGDTISAEYIISRLSTLYGSGNKYECASCAEIVSQYWGSSGRFAMYLISRIVTEVLWPTGSHSVHGTWKDIVGMKEIHYEETRSHLTLTINPVHQGSETKVTADQIFEALGWVCAAIRQTPKHPVSSGVTESQLYISRKIKKSLPYRNTRKSLAATDDSSATFTFIALEPLETMPATQSPSSCWTKLFTSVPVVEATVKRSWGSGLKVSFDLMVRLAAVQNYCCVEGGSFLLGFYTALIPTEVNEENDSIQWHFECLDSKEGTLLPEDLKLLDRKWARLGPEEIQSKTCFVGWYDQANIMLGTKRLFDSQGPMTRSQGLRVKEKEHQYNGFEGGGQVSFKAGLIDLVLKGAYQVELINIGTRFDPSDDYLSCLHDEKMKVCLTIDNASKQAWLLPLLTVMLYLCHCYYQDHFSNSKPSKIPFARPTVNGVEAVMEAIEAFGETNIQPNENGPPYLFHQLFHKLLLRLKSPRLPEAKGSRIFAIELMDVLEAQPTFPKEIDTQHDQYSWDDLVPFTRLVDVVAVCENIGHAIEPDTSQHCRCKDSCQRVPEHRGYLTAPVSVLNALVGRGRGTFEPNDVVTKGKSEITPGTWWIPDSDPWQWTGNTQARCCGIWTYPSITPKVLQRTFSRKRLTTMTNASHHTRVIRQIPPDGAVIFGRGP